MNKRIFTGSYDKCKAGNLISISFDKGKSAGFEGKMIQKKYKGKKEYVLLI